MWLRNKTALYIDIVKLAPVQQCNTLPEIRIAGFIFQIVTFDCVEYDKRKRASKAI
jgi:hypothetical protein